MLTQSSTADEFNDLMPHELKVTSKGTKDDYAYDGWDTTSVRNYRCLIDDSQTIQRNTEGVTLNMGLTAYVNAIPIGKTEPQNILGTDKVEVVTPVEYSRVRPVASIARHFYKDGSLHNLEIKFS